MSEAYAQAEQHKDIAFREVDVDAMAADLYTRPQRYDVLLVTNMFGDILSNEACALSGGLGLAAALNMGDEHAIANAGHGSAPDLVGKGIANPSGLMLSGGHADGVAGHAAQEVRVYRCKPRDGDCT